jgi:hypothetical protein
MRFEIQLRTDEFVFLIMPLRHGKDRYDLTRLKSVVALCDKRAAEDVSLLMRRVS